MPAWLILTMLLISACETFTEWPLQPESDTRLVVEAILTDERIHQEMRLSKSYAGINDSVPGVADAEIEVEANGVSYRFLPDPSEAGLYRSQEPFKVLDQLLYKLTIHWQDSVYTASSELSFVGPLPRIRFQKHPRRDSMALGDVGNIFSTSQQAMYEVNIDWSHLVNDSLARARMFYYTFSSVHISELIRPSRERIWFPTGSIVIVKKFGLNDDFADYLRAMAIETDWNGTFYYTDSGNLPTNISSDGIGFFSTCAVLSDTLIAE
ncbi:MAG: DUF4249 family protein [Bacteroidota bacterium]